MRTCEIRIGSGRGTRWIRAYQDAQRGPLCIDCAVCLHPRIRSDLLGDQGDVYDPVFEDDRERMHEVVSATCSGFNPPHGVLCDPRARRRRAEAAQLDIHLIRRWPKRS